MSREKNNDWWRGAVMYQIYPRSFYDSNNDGIGDLPGITQKLDYVASLGVDGIWLSPFFKSPMKDFGYDVSDYRAVDPIFGTIDDFDRLLEKAHKLGLKVIIDQVLNHTSDRHPWFIESRSSRDNAKADWYIWADPKADGTPPNNWQSIFNAAAWTYSARRRQYYMHNFLSSQPDLNFHNKDVQDALLSECRFWLERGVDGFRLDTANFYFHDKQLRDNPPRPAVQGTATQLSFMDPYGMQLHIHDKSQPENFAFLARLRNLTDEYPGTMTLGELGDDNVIKLTAAYTENGKYLHTCYNFSLMNGQRNKLTPALVRAPVEAFMKEGPQSWPSWAFSNHDVVRAVTRFSKEGSMADPRLARLLIALLCSLRGTAFMLQGEELGLPESENIPFEKLQDPWGIALYPEWQGRDGCRTPLPWSNKDKNAGFSAAEPWLPVENTHYPLSVDVQDKDKGSTLSFVRSFLKWRKEHPALIQGAISFLESEPSDVLAFERANDGKAILCLFNTSDQERVWKNSKYGEIALAPFEAAFRE